MAHLIRITTILLFILSFSNLKAETWNEPWQKEIIEKSDYFVLGKVIEKTDSFAKIKVEKNFGDKTLPEVIIIDDYFLLELTSSSGQELENDLENNISFYLLLKMNSKGNFSLPTPTSGHARLDENKNVYATYRHSYHLALVPQSIYELTFNNIWDYYKRNIINEKEINDFINRELKNKPASFDEDEINDFFLQHVALETAYLLDLTPDFNEVIKFAKSDNFHSKVSALQLLGNYKTKEANEFLFNSIQDLNYDNFQKVISIWAIKKNGDIVFINKLKSIKDNLSDEETGFGGNIMDPRVGTYFPTPKIAVESL